MMTVYSIGVIGVILTLPGKKWNAVFRVQCRMHGAMQEYAIVAGQSVVLIPLSNHLFTTSRLPAGAKMNSWTRSFAGLLSINLVTCALCQSAQGADAPTATELLDRWQKALDVTQTAAMFNERVERQSVPWKKSTVWRRNSEWLYRDADGRFETITRFFMDLPGGAAVADRPKFDEEYGLLGWQGDASIITA